MPKMGESIVEATVLKWLKKPGDKVALDEPIMEIATDKVDSEVPSPVEGVLSSCHGIEGEVIPVGKVIAVIETEVLSGTQKPESPSSFPQKEISQPQIKAPVMELATIAQTHVSGGNGHHSSKSDSGKFYSPLVLNIARQEGVAMGELESLEGTGLGGRVTKKDILSYIKGPRNPVATQPAATMVKSVPTEKIQTQNQSGFLQVPLRSFSHSGNVEIQEMDRMRKMIAENMVYSKHVSAHVTSFVEADVTNMVLWRNRVKNEFEKKYGTKLTYTPMFVEAVVKALRENPMVNISVDGDKILIKKDVNIGIAVALPSDNLIVPVIKNADRMNLFGLSAAINDLAERARVNKLKLEELEGGTYTISNVGTFGNVMGTPVIMQPQCAILATGAIRKKPAVIETEEGDFIGVRQLMFLSHSYDHRVIDGSLGGRFVRRVADFLEAWDPNREV